MIAAVSPVAGSGHSTAASIFLLEPCYLDPIGARINLVMVAGAFRRLDRNQQSRCGGPTTPKPIHPNLLRSIRLRQASLGEEDEMSSTP